MNWEIYALRFRIFEIGVQIKVRVETGFPKESSMV
jgi:hypothetical protein